MTGNEPRVVRVFISSTFRDMQAERDHLVTVVFPELRERLDKLGLELYDVDLRWGVPQTGVDGERANSWAYCKQWIDRVEPFFVCLLGQRYGWVPPASEIADEGDRRQYEGLSITEMEIRHAVLSRRHTKRSFFYSRTTTVPPEADAAARELFVDEAEVQGKLAALTGEIREHSGRPLRDYPATWTGDGFADLDAFGRLVLEDLWSGVLRDARYVSKEAWRQALGCDPDIDPRYTDDSVALSEEDWKKIVAQVKPAPKDPLDAEAEQMAAFAASRLRWFQGRGRELAELAAFVSDDLPADASRLSVVRAVAGQGKSALLAKLAEGLADSPHLVIAHFVGATERSGDVRNLLERLVQEWDRHGLPHPEEGDSKLDLESLRKRLAARLEGYSGERRVVFLLDAVNQLTGGHDLSWLPRALGPQLRIVLSCLDDPDAPADSPRVRVISALEGRQPETRWIGLGHLRRCEVRRILVEFLQEYCKELDRRERVTISLLPQARNPLYLLVVLQELRALGGADMHLKVPGFIADLSRERPNTVALFDWVLERLEVFGREEVCLWCSYLALGRVGMSGRELHDLLLRKLGDPAGPAALRIERALRRYLQRRGAQWDFFHDQLREAVAQRYLRAEDTRRAAHRDMAEYFHSQEYWVGSPEDRRRWAQAVPTILRSANTRKTEELAWHWWLAGQWDDAAQALTDLRFLEAKAEAGLVLDLADDFTRLLESFPADHPQRTVLQLLERALRRDIHPISRDPTTLFQALWNTAWWHDCSLANRVDFLSQPGVPSPPSASKATQPALSNLLERWRRRKNSDRPGFFWVRSLLPPRPPLEGQLMSMLTNQGFSVTVLSFSPDGARLIAGGPSYDLETNHLVLLDSQTSQLLAAIQQSASMRVWRMHIYKSEEPDEYKETQAGPAYVAWAPHGRQFAWTVGGSGRAEVWDTLPLGKRLELTSLEGNCRLLAYSPDGRRILAVTDEGTVHRWDADTGLPDLTTELGFPCDANCLALTPDARLCAAGLSDRTVGIWDLREHKEVARMQQTAANPFCLSLSPDGTRLAGSGMSGEVTLWDVPTGGAVFTMPGHGERVNDIAFSPDGSRIVTASGYDSTDEDAAYVWDASNGSLLARLRFHDAPVQSLAFAPQGLRLATASTDGAIAMWDLARKPDENDVTEAVRYRGIAQFRFASSGELLLVESRQAGGDRVHLRSNRVTDVVRTLHSPDLLATDAAFSPDSALLALGGGSQVTVWEVSDLRCIATLKEEGVRIRTVAFSQDGEWIAAGGCLDQHAEGRHSWGYVTVWDVRGRRSLYRLTTKSEVLCARFSCDRQLLAVGRWLAPVDCYNTGSWSHERVVDHGSATQLAFSEDGRFLYALTDPLGLRHRGREAAERIPLACTQWDLSTGTRVLEAFIQTDVEALARGSYSVAFTGAAGTTFTLRGDPRLAARFPVSFDTLVAHHDGRTWAGIRHKRLYLMQLEGEESESKL